MQSQTDYSTENQPSVFQARPLKEDAFFQPRQPKREPFGELANNNSPSKLQKQSLKQTSPFKLTQEVKAGSDHPADKRTPKKGNFLVETSQPKAAELSVFNQPCKYENSSATAQISGESLNKHG